MTPQQQGAWDGVPENPEECRWHVLEHKSGSHRICLEWTDEDGGPGCFGWRDDGDGDPDSWARFYRYVSPVRTDADLRAARAEGYAQGIEAAAEIAGGAIRAADGTLSLIDPWHAPPNIMKVHRDACIRGDMAANIEQRIRALSIPAEDAAALAELEARVRAEENEACARWFDDRADMMEREAAENGGFGKNTALLCRGYAAALRARRGGGA